MALVYLMGSMRNEKIPQVAKLLRTEGFEPFWDWMHSGPESDDHWQAYSRDYGRSYLEALRSPHAINVFEFDKKWLSKADAACLVLPAGKSAHIELGWFCSKKPSFVLLDGEPERFDIMYNFVYDNGGAVCMNEAELVKSLRMLVGGKGKVGFDLSERSIG